MSENCCLNQQGRCSNGPEAALFYVLHEQYSKPLGAHDADYLHQLRKHLKVAHSKDFNFVIAMATLCTVIFAREEARKYFNQLNEEDCVGIRLKIVAKYGFVDNAQVNFEHAEQGAKNEAIVGAIAASDLEMIEYLKALGAELDTDDATLGMAAVEAEDLRVMEYLAQRGIDFFEHRVVEVVRANLKLKVFEFLAEQGNQRR